MGTPVVGYSVERLRVGSDEQWAASLTSIDVQEGLLAHRIEAAMLGAVPAAAGFHAALAHVRDRQAADAAAESVRRADLAARATRTADLGTALVDDTTAAAVAATPANGRPPGGG
jgi:hypothetical protein